MNAFPDYVNDDVCGVGAVRQIETSNANTIETDACDGGGHVNDYESGDDDASPHCGFGFCSDCTVSGASDF